MKNERDERKKEEDESEEEKRGEERRGWGEKRLNQTLLWGGGDNTPALTHLFTLLPSFPRLTCTYA